MLTTTLTLLALAIQPQTTPVPGPVRSAATVAATPSCVATIADMQALAPPTPLPGGVGCVHVLGFHAPGDGGGGLFSWSASSGAAEDGGLVFASTHPSAPAAARWTRLVAGALQASWWGLEGDGSDETSALQAAFDAAAGNSLVFDRPGQFGFSTPLSIPSDCRLTTNGTTLLLLADPGGASFAVTVSDRVSANELSVHAAGGFQARRVLLLGSDNEIGRVRISSANQQVTSPSNVDGAFQIRGTHVHVGSVRISNFDTAGLCYLASHVVIDHVRITDYTNGMHLRESNWVQILSAQIDQPSPNATTVPGHNGVLIETCHDILLSNATIHDAGEHAVRVGGYESSRLVFSNIQSIRPGQCGFKINPSDTVFVRDVQISGLTVVDASATSATGTNEDGLRLEHCQHVIVDGFQVQRQILSTSCHVGIYIDSCVDVTVNGPRITDTNSHGIHLQDNAAAVNSIYINNPSIFAPGGDGIFIESPTQVLRDIIITKAYIRGQLGWGMHLRANAATVGVNQPVVLDGWVKNDGQGIVDVSTSDPDVHVSIVALP